MVFHPNVVDFYSLGESEGQEFIEMEYVGGGTLDRFLRRCESLGQVLEVYAQVCDGLQHIHENGLVHRDIKPANIVTHGRRWKLIDFDASVEVDDDDSLDFEQSDREGEFDEGGGVALAAGRPKQRNSTAMHANI